MKNKLKNLPSQPGIYLFFNSDKELIYVGKATSLKDRVRSYFSGSNTSRPIENLIHEVKNIKWIVTDSVLEAIILESIYIKDKDPKYNVLGKDDKSWNYIGITKDEFPTLKTIRQHEYKQLTDTEKRKKYGKIFGPFPGLKTKETLKLLRQIFTYSTCKPDQERACFYHQIEQCLGVCTNEITPAEYKRKSINPLSLFLNGKKKQLIKTLEQRMKRASRDENFEEAQRLRDQIQNLQKIHDVALLNKSFFINPLKRLQNNYTRIEGYDISNLGSTGIVGSLVVFEHGEPIKSDYRKFKIKTLKGQSDVDALAEMIDRRAKRDDWPLPDLFLIDGGKPQVNKVNQVLKEHNIKTPVIGIAKGAARKKNEFHVPRNKKLTDWLGQHKNILIQVRDEAHRFAITYQRSLRKIK